MKKAAYFLLAWLLVTSCAKVLLDNESCISEIKRTYSLLGPDAINKSRRHVMPQHANSVALFNSNVGYHLGAVYPTNINAKHSKVYFPVAVIVNDNSKTQPYFNGIFTASN